MNPTTEDMQAARGVAHYIQDLARSGELSDEAFNLAEKYANLLKGIMAAPFAEKPDDGFAPWAKRPPSALYKEIAAALVPERFRGQIPTPIIPTPAGPARPPSESVLGPTMHGPYPARDPRKKGRFEKARDEMDSWLRTGHDANADDTLEHVAEHFRPRDLWGDKIDDALQGAWDCGKAGVMRPEDPGL